MSKFQDWVDELLAFIKEKETKAYSRGYAEGYIKGLQDGIEEPRKPE